MVFIPLKIRKIAAMAIKIPKTKTYGNNGFSWLLKALLITIGPRNKSGKAPERYWIPFIRMFLFVGIYLELL